MSVSKTRPNFLGGKAKPKRGNKRDNVGQRGFQTTAGHGGFGRLHPVDGGEQVIPGEESRVVNREKQAGVSGKGVGLLRLTTGKQTIQGGYRKASGWGKNRVLLVK